MRHSCLRVGAHAPSLPSKVLVRSRRPCGNAASSSPPQATPSSAHRTMTTSECIFRLLSLLPVLNSVQIVLVTIAKKKSLEKSKWSLVYSFDHTNEPRWCHYHGSLPHGNAIGYGLYSTSDPEIGNEMLDFSLPTHPQSLLSHGALYSPPTTSQLGVVSASSWQ